ncbi:unnamed protein product, partial [Mesorhabditis belari]|uniref:WD_REPEATS_REGION domain-containing protein n=1 Tax=Mesorhabditis belari TaxID=2138241 RepID=A0AAF3FMU9_9BILA
MEGFPDTNATLSLNTLKVQSMTEFNFKENKRGEDYEPTIGIENLIEGTSSIPEALYILHHFTQFAVDQATLATRATANQKEAEARIVQLEQQSFINEQLLESVIIDHNIVDEISRVVEAQNRRKTSRTQSRGSSSARANSPSQANGNDDSPLHDYKVRRRTATADELLYPQEGETNGTTNETALLSERSTTEDRHKRRNKKGRIVSASGGGVRIVKTALLDGHVKPVLSIDGNENFLITGSKDRLAKVWDLERGEEIATLGVHPNNVHAVRFVPNSHLAISASMYQMRVWDLREMKCVRLLQSSGQVVEGDGGSIGSRQNTVPFLETVVNAIEIDPTGELLFSSFCGDVRVWCLSKMASFGRLVGAAHSPRSEVSCLSVAVNPERNVCNVFTGSRDHYVKMYALPTTGEGVHEAAVEFNPPHYDNVTCIVSYDQHIYTASKDMNIMKINLVDNKRDHLELKAHNSYVQGLCLAPLGSETLLASCCKEGTIKLWDVTSTRRMRLVETIEKAHSESINNICHSSGLLFTASSDTTVGVWRPNMSL